jgi:DNA-binding MarR family transcriptional regulator
MQSSPVGLHEASTDDFALEEQPSHLLRRAHQRAAALFSSDLGPEHLTPPQFAALAKLDEQGAVSQNSLGRMIAMDAATMQGVVARLADRGLVSRTPDPSDRRRVSLSLTAAGQRTVQAAYADVQRVEREILAPLTARERQTLMRLLKRLS